MDNTKIGKERRNSYQKNEEVSRWKAHGVIFTVCSHSVTLLWLRKTSVKLPCVYVCLSSRGPFIFSVRVSSFFPYFCFPTSRLFNYWKMPQTYKIMHRTIFFLKFREKFYKELVWQWAIHWHLFLAEVYIIYFKTYITSSFSWMFKSYFCYVGDICAIINKKHVEDFLKLLNSQKPEIKFTIEVQTENYLPFLDLNVMKDSKSIKFCIHKKICRLTAT